MNGPTLKVGIALLALGAGLAALGQATGGPFLGAAIAVWGAAAMVAGLDSVIRRRHRTGERDSSDLPREHFGFSAVVFGLTFFLVGVGLIVAGTALAAGANDGLWSWVGDNTGAFIMALGAWVCVVGVATVISRWRYVEVSTVWWQRLPGMSVGLVTMAIGAAALAVGRSLAVDPPADVLESVVDTLERWLGGG